MQLMRDIRANMLKGSVYLLVSEQKKMIQNYIK